MIFALVVSVMSVFAFVEPAVSVGGFLMDHPHPLQEVTELKPDTPEWRAACMNQYHSFSPDTGLWYGLDKKWHPCRFRKVWH